MRKLTAQVTVRTDDGKTYAIAFVDGAVAAAASPLPNDAITRVALTSHFVSPVQVGEITRRLAAERDRDEVDVVADAGRLSAEHAATLRQRVTIQRAARTFAIDRGTFEIDDEVTLPTRAGFTVPLGAAIFQGVRMNLSEQRLVEDLRELGTSYVLRPTTTDADIAAHGFEGDVRSVISALRKGTTLAELELASHRDLEPRTLHAMVYALASGGFCIAAGGQAVDRTAPPAPRTSTGLVNTSHVTIKVDQPLVTRTRTTMTPANVPRTTQQTMPPTNVPRTATPTVPPTNGARPISQPPTNVPQQGGSERPRAASQPPIQQERPGATRPFGNRSGTIPPRTATPTGMPLRTPTMPPRNQTPTSSPLDEFIKETTTNRGFSSIEELTKSGPHAVVDEFKREASTSRGLSSMTVPPAQPRTITTPRTITERDRAKKEIETLIVARIEKLEKGCDYFAILGLPFEAPLDAVRNNYVEISRRLHPDSLAQVGIDDAKPAQRVLAQVNAAFQTLTDANKRRDYINSQKRGEPTPIAPRARSGDLDQTELAAEAFQAGEGALRRDDIPRAVEELGRAVTLAPANLEYMAMFAWAQFCAANDKQKVYVETRKTLERAIHRSDKPVIARFYLGRVERMVGHDREAMNHFQEVLLDEPHNREAASELRVLEQRLARGTKPKR